ncbi:hypothetical protein HPB50_008732 [Hyalomma asiaticum]|uniref:Uncharacterized protein n=1 Tax=Hyalomma asiaticum TaxID=266040 RepID=A0ACB7SC05_HYAAI|nr:hypothetical protein HPB50_008732 [Hyalomma asiaticum]
MQLLQFSGHPRRRALDPCDAAKRTPLLMQKMPYHVVDLLNRCTCPSQFPMIRVADGKYRIGDTKVLIFVRILRSHVMVRVGGGWDTLEHYPRQARPMQVQIRTSTSAKLTMTAGKGGSPTMQVTYNRPPAPSYPYGSTSPLMSHRGLPHNNSLTGDHDRDLTPSRISHCSDDSTSSSSGGCGVPADSSSETSEGEFAKTPGGSRKCSPRKIAKTGNVTPQPGEFASTNGSTGPWKMTPPERPDSAGGLPRSHDVVDSGAASADESYASSASPSASPAKTNGTTSSPRHSISGVGSRQTPPPLSAKSRIPHLAAPHRATSSENLTTNGSTSPTPQHHQQQQLTKQQQLTATNGRVRQSSTPPNPNARRRSVDAGTGHSAPFQVSQQRRKHDCRQGLPYARRSWPLFVEKSAPGPDYAEPGSKRSAVHSSPTKSQRPNVISPLLQELLREKDLDSDDKILKKMEFIVNHYRSRLDRGECGEANGSATLPKASHTAPTSPDSFCSPPCRRRGSKIPMATYYDRD